MNDDLKVAICKVLGISLPIAIVIINIRQPADPILGNVMPLILSLISLYCWGEIIFNTHKWRAIGFLFTGAILNLIAVLANNGYMPATGYERYAAAGLVGPYHVTADGARLIWLCDWIGGHMSIGDTLIFSGFIIFVVFAIREYRLQRRHEQQALA